MMLTLWSGPGPRADGWPSRTSTARTDAQASGGAGREAMIGRGVPVALGNSEHALDGLTNGMGGPAVAEKVARNGLLGDADSGRDFRFGKLNFLELTQGWRHDNDTSTRTTTHG